jgi:hypothetical protein
MAVKLKSLTIYVDEQAYTFLKYKVSEGFKISSYIRFLVREALQKEQGGKK